MKPLLFPLLLLIACQSFSQSAPQDLVREIKAFPTKYPENTAYVSAADEPGTPMQLLVKVLRREDHQAISQETIFFYHTTDAGVYETTRPQDPTSAKLKAYIQTNAEGYFLIQSIVPGQYPNSNNDPHIHFQLDSASPPYCGTVFSHNVSPKGRKEAEKNKEIFIAEMYPDGKGGYVGRVQIQLENYSHQK